MFKIEDKEYDETKLEDKGKRALANIQLLAKERDTLLLQLERNKVLTEHYTSIVKENLPKELQNVLDKDEHFQVLKNNIQEVKNFVMNKI